MVDTDVVLTVCSCSHRALQLVATPSKLTPPFPQIFSPSVGAQGFLQPEVAPPAGGECVFFLFVGNIVRLYDQLVPAAPLVSSVPVLTSLQSGPALHPWLSELHRAAGAFDIRRVAPSFLSQGPELSEYQEALEELRLLARRYRDDSGGVMRSSSSSEDD